MRFSFRRAAMPTLMLACAAALLATGHVAQAADYYLSPSGDDSASGMAGHPWQTIAKLNTVHLTPGDRVLLASGGVFPGGIVLDKTEAGTYGHSITICSTGAVPATIAASGVDGISAVAGGLTVKNLILKGNATGDGKDYGIAFNTAAPDGARYPYIAIDHVEITGFGGDGIYFHSEGKGQPGYEDVSITHVHIHDIYGTGISSNNDVPAHIPSYAHKRFTITDCDTSNNHSGSGIILGGVQDASVEYCHSADNLGHGGGVGIWAYASKNVVFRYCIASGTRTNNGGDGGGFDLDGGCKDCTVVNCLSYNNDGPGYMHCDYPTAPPTDGNLITRSISVNDGRKAKGDSYGFGFCNWGSGLSNDVISHNLAIITEGDSQNRQNGVYWATFIPESDQDLKNNSDVQQVTGCVFEGNIAYVAGQGVAYVTNELKQPTAANLVYRRNAFRSIPGASPVYKLGDAKWSAQTAWAKAISQPSAASQLTAPPLPGLTNKTAASLTEIKDPHRLPGLQLFKEMDAR